MEPTPKPKRARKQTVGALLTGFRDRTYFLFQLVELLEEMERYVWQTAPQFDPSQREEWLYPHDTREEFEVDRAREMLNEALALMADGDPKAVRDMLDATHAELAAVFSRLLSRTAK